jgi:uncharacterized membrane protein (UPF0127 family)
MDLCHEPAGERAGGHATGSSVLAADVEYAEGTLGRARGLMFQSSIPDDYALVFEFDGASERSIHMLFVRFPIDVLWLVDGEVTRRETLRPWRGLAVAEADTVVELPAGAADAVAVGDRVWLAE